MSAEIVQDISIVAVLAAGISMFNSKFITKFTGITKFW